MMDSKKKNEHIEINDEQLKSITGGIAEARNLGDTGVRHISSASNAGGIVGYVNGAGIINCNSRLSDETIEDETMLIIPIV